MVELETHQCLGQDLREVGLRIRNIEHEGAVSRVVELTDLEDQHRVGLGTATALSDSLVSEKPVAVARCGGPMRHIIVLDDLE
tara:strand:+ start:49 stop:297 length:249 start_codon:yes stop_codon:yes gene_type:complete